MAWELKKVEDQRRELVEAYLKGMVTMTELCTRFRVSRKTAYKWLNRYKSSGIDGLKDLSKAPQEPYRIFSDEVKKIIESVTYVCEQSVTYVSDCTNEDKKIALFLVHAPNAPEETSH